MSTKGTTSKQPTGAAGYLQIVEQGILWTAPSGAVIRVRDISVADRAVLDALPTHLQEAVNTIIDQSAALRTEDEAEALGTLTEIFGGEDKSLRTALDREYELGVHLCVAGWIEPEVVPTPADVTDPERQIPAARILPSDRRAFMARVFGGDEVEAGRLATFPRQ